MNTKDKIRYLEKSNTALKQEVQKLRQIIKSYKYDKLTGFLLRSDFQDRLDEMWYEFNEFGHRFIIAMIDLDGLHDLNRDISFEAGDDFIKQISNELKEHFEDSNLFRVGGDEFMILRRGNNIENFLEKLNNITRSTTAAFLVNKENVKKFNINNEQEIFNTIDAMVIAKKPKGRRKEDVDRIRS